MSIFEERNLCICCEQCKPIRQMAYYYDEIGICNNCNSKIESTKDLTFEGKEYIDMVVAPFIYSGIMQDVVRGFKFHGQRLYGKFLANIMMDKVEKLNLFRDFDLIIPVPLHKKRLDERGYNQSEVIAKIVSERTNIKLSCDALIRVRNTQHQSRLSGIDRIENVKDAFFAYEEEVFGKNIILIDDIYTMGETANFCGKALIEAGAKRVIALTVCKTIKKESAIFI